MLDVAAMIASHPDVNGLSRIYTNSGGHFYRTTTEKPTASKHTLFINMMCLVETLQFNT